MKVTRSLQLSLPSPRTWGGRRRGAGRKPTPGRRPGVPHCTRPAHIASCRGFRVIHFSAQDDHLHLIVEADNTRALRHGLRGLVIRLARAVNHALGRRGAVFGDRYHARTLTTPRAVRFALIYVLRNRQKHSAGERGLDPCSSAPWFDGWRESIPPVAGSAPVVRARTWLAAVGWRRHGLIATDDRPRSHGCRRRRLQRSSPHPRV
ncbi:MAG: hypothetical protein E6J56_11555 [Deltaproteobacteria bacterium]|nr:MAG: hypothetical protein E6J56_11555 [Deltaproteobacteria bacterium]